MLACSRLRPSYGRTLTLAHTTTTTTTTTTTSMARVRVRQLHVSPVLAKRIAFNLADIGEGITECELVQWFVKEGDEIQQFDKLCEVQSDKATVEITSRFDGRVAKLHYQQGQMAKVGSPLVDIDTDADDSALPTPPSPTPAPISTTTTNTSTTPTAAPPTVEDSGEGVLATPAVRRMAREYKISLSQLNGTGRAGRITKEDILNHVSSSSNSTAASPSSTTPTFALTPAPGQKQTVKLTPVQKAMVKSMQQSLLIPHFGFSDEVRFNALKQLRSSINQQLARQPITVGDTTINKLTFMPFLIKSFSIALEKYPLLNAQYVPSTDGTSPGHLVYRPDHNIGLAIDSPSGLVVPNLAMVNRKSILDIAADMIQLTSLAQKGQLPPSAFKETTITLSNIGNIGGRVLGPVIPPDTVCIAAIGRMQALPRFSDTLVDPTTGQKCVVEEQVVTVSFSADHRVVDGASVARFFAEWKRLLEDPASMVLSLR